MYSVTYSVYFFSFAGSSAISTHAPFSASSTIFIVNLDGFRYGK